MGFLEDKITPKIEIVTTMYKLRKILNSIKDKPLLAFDIETRSMYSNDEIKEAKEILKNPDSVDKEDLIMCKQVANSSGLSHPSIARLTHVNLAYSITDTIIVIISSDIVEKYILEWLVTYKGKVLIHNASFDLKMVHHRTGKFPNNYEDTQLLAKSLINHVDTWKANTGLKELMKDYYPREWTLVEDYHNENLKDDMFIRYCSYDVSATFKLWEQLQETIEEMKNE